MKFIRVSKENTEVVIEKPGTYVAYMYNFSGTCAVDIRVEQAEVYIFGMFIGQEADTFSVHTIQKHSVGDSVSNLLIKGVFLDKAKFHYEGLIAIDQGAQRSNAYQKNQNLLLSSDAYVDSRPYLEIKANDVRCTHGSTTGKLDPQQILYLKARGLDTKQAQRILIEGYAYDLTQKMQELGIEQSIMDEVKGGIADGLKGMAAAADIPV